MCVHTLKEKSLKLLTLNMEKNKLHGRALADKDREVQQVDVTGLSNVLPAWLHRSM